MYEIVPIGHISEYSRKELLLLSSSVVGVSIVPSVSSLMNQVFRSSGVVFRLTFVSNCIKYAVLTGVKVQWTSDLRPFGKPTF